MKNILTQCVMIKATVMRCSKTSKKKKNYNS